MAVCRCATCELTSARIPHRMGSEDEKRKDLPFSARLVGDAVRVDAATLGRLVVPGDRGVPAVRAFAHTSPDERPIAPLDEDIDLVTVSVVCLDDRVCARTLSCHCDSPIYSWLRNPLNCRRPAKFS